MVFVSRKEATVKGQENVQENNRKNPKNSKKRIDRNQSLYYNISMCDDVS